MCVPPSAHVPVSKGGREEADVVSEGSPCDMTNRIMFGENGALEERRVVGVKRDGPERRRCGARLAKHHRMRGCAVIEVQLGEFARSVVGTFRIGARSRLEANADLPRPERVDVAGPVGPLFGGRRRIRRGVGVSVGGTELCGREWYRQRGTMGPCSPAPEHG